MKNVKKVAAAIVAGGLLVTAFSGCGKEEKSALKKIEYWTPDSHSKSVVLDLVDNWNKKKGKELGVEIVYTVKEGDIQQATEMAFASKQGPDMFTSVQIEKNRAAGNIKAIDDIKGGKEWIESTYKPEDYDGSSFKGLDGKIYCLPFGVNTFGLVYNKDMFKKYGIVDENGEPTPPETFEEVREYAKKMTDPSKQDYGIVMPMKWGAFYSVDVGQLLIGSNGMTAFDCVNGKYDYSGFKPIWDMYVGIKNDGSYFPGSESLDNDMARAYFAEKNIGMKFAGSFDVGVFNSQFPAKCDWGVAPYPVADKNHKYLQHMGKGGWAAISNACVDRVGDDTALELIKFAYSKDNARALYKAGMTIYFDPSVIEGIEPDKNLKGWKEFSDLVSISTAGYTGADYDLTGEKGAQALFMEDIWTGKVAVDDAIKDLNKRVNAGMEKYYKNNPDKDFNELIRPDWNIERK